MISVQTEDFSVQDLYEQLRQKDANATGAICTFTGLVRDFGDDKDLQGIELEHYPGMTLKSLQKIVDEAKTRWNIIDSVVVHRIGKLFVSDQIVFVGVCSSHRADAFAATEFIMDYLKTSAPFWKKELKGSQSTWVEAKQSDADRFDKWK